MKTIPATSKALCIKSLFMLLLMTTTLSLTSCDDDDPDDPYVPSTSQQSTTKITAPTYKKNLTTTTPSDVTFYARFDNGGDSGDNMKCKVHWGKYSSKQSKTPKASALTHSESMTSIQATKSSTYFKKAHTGFSRGTYIYYYFECSNSKYTTKSNVTYCITTGA